jgi:hypothetical protein
MNQSSSRVRSLSLASFARNDENRGMQDAS